MVWPGDSLGAMVGDVPPSVSRYMAEIGRKGGAAGTGKQSRARKLNFAKSKGRPRSENPSPAALAMRAWRAKHPKKAKG